MIQRCLASFTRDFSEVFSGTVESQYRSAVLTDHAALGFWWAPILSSAIPSRAILPDRAPCADSRDAQDAPGRRRSGSAGFLPSPGASRSPSRPTTATREATALPKWADGPHGVADAWGAHPDLLFARVRVRVVFPVPRRWRSTQCPRHTVVPVESDPYEIACPFHNLHPPAPLPRAPAAPALAESAPEPSLAWFETPSVWERPLVHNVPHPGTTLPAGRVARRWANSPATCLATNSPPPGNSPICPTPRNTDGPPLAECIPCLGKPVSSTIHATTGPCFCMAGSTCCRTCSSIS